MLTISNISFSYDGKKVIDEVSFSVAKGQHVSIIGESGCGKSTLLKLIYGLYDLDKGEIVNQGKPVLGPKYHLIPGEERMKYLAQDFDLMPYITAAENIGKNLSNMSKVAKQLRINEILAMVGMTQYSGVKAQFLSGGQKQRVALAKALASAPDIILLDEPFSQMDIFRTNSLRRKLFNYFNDKEITCIIATHDASDVLSFSNETLVMKDGRLIAEGSPRNLYDNPPNEYTASLFGDVNEIAAQWIDPSLPPDKIMYVYPHQLGIVSESEFKAVVKKSYFKGNHFLIEAEFKGKVIYFENKEIISDGIKVSLALNKGLKDIH